MSDAVLTSSNRSTRASSIVVDEDDEQKPEEDNSDADTVRMTTPDYEGWASENCRIESQNLFHAESTPASTFLKYRSCQQSDYTQIARSGSPIAGEESNKTGVFKKEASMKSLHTNNPAKRKMRNELRGQFSETTIDASKAERANAMTRLAGFILKEFVYVLL
ncbi:hypothetical protein AtubIFM55763_011643 [Aspergillus tubingensis]|nr:hypothetical protein AtubIFM55763_011643 [Aspergillus tubingensis]